MRSSEKLDNREVRNSAPLLTVTYRPSARSFIPTYWVEASIVSVIFTLLIGIPNLFNTDSPYTDTQAIVLLTVHLITLVPPMAHMLGVYKRHKDLFHPSLIAALSYIVFHVVLNPIVFADPVVLASRKLDTTSGFLLTNLVLHSYVVLFVAWCAYYAGHALLPGLGDRVANRTTLPPTTRLYMGVGIAFVVIGIIGNVGIIGGLATYIAKMRYFYERWQIYEQLSQEGSTKWLIYGKFLPLGLLILAYGHYLRKQFSYRRFLVLAVLVSVLNVFLSGSSGGRGVMLTTAFYAIILVNHSLKRLTMRSLLTVLMILLVFAYILGQLRGAAYFGTQVVWISAKALTEFGSLYLTNYLGTLSLVAQVQATGTVHGATAFAGITGLLGGPTPNSTESEMWIRLTGQPLGVNFRYSAPGELYFNFGWIGLVIGMFLIGLSVKALAAAYDRAAGERTVASGMIAVFATFSANFLIIGNLDYLPSYFTYFSVPFYFTFWAFRNRRC